MSVSPRTRGEEPPPSENGPTSEEIDAAFSDMVFGDDCPPVLRTEIIAFLNAYFAGDHTRAVRAQKRVWRYVSSVIRARASVKRPARKAPTRRSQGAKK
jgi:hypothetical protein